MINAGLALVGLAFAMAVFTAWVAWQQAVQP